MQANPPNLKKSTPYKAVTVAVPTHIKVREPTGQFSNLRVETNNAGGGFSDIRLTPRGTDRYVRFKTPGAGQSDESLAAASSSGNREVVIIVKRPGIALDRYEIPLSKLTKYNPDPAMGETQFYLLLDLKERE